MKRPLQYSCLVLAGILLGPIARGDGPETPAMPRGLDSLIELAMTNNPDLSAETAKLAEAEATLNGATAAFMPRLTARVGYEYSNDPSRAFSYVVAQRRFDFGMSINHPGWVENFRPELVGSWSLYRGGEDHYRRLAAELGVEVAALERQALQNRLRAAVIAAYYTWLTAPEQMEVARQTIGSIESEIHHTRQKVAAGSALKADALSLDVRMAEAREAEIRAENALTLSRSSLEVLIGTRLPEKMEPMEREDGNVPEPDLQELLTQAKAHRPELQAVLHQVAIRQAELKAERAALMPRVNAYAAYGLNSRGPDMDFNRDNMTVGLNAEVDLFTGGAVRAKIEAAVQRVNVAEAQAQRMRLNIEDDVRRAVATLGETMKRKITAEMARQSAEEALRLVRLQYQGGTASVTRYLEAETDQANTHLKVIMARYEARIAAAQLDQATGGHFLHQADFRHSAPVTPTRQGHS